MKREKNPRCNENPAAKANFFSSHVSQSWLSKTLSKGSKTPLTESDICEVLERDSTTYLSEKLGKAWQHEVKVSKKPSLLIPLMKVAGYKYFSSLVFALVEMSMRVIVSIYIGKIVASFNSVDGVDKESGYLFAAVITICTFVEAIVHHPLFLESLRTGMDVRIALSAVIYNKALRMSQASLALTDTGQIVNLVTNDVQKTEEVLLFGLLVIPAPVVLLIASYLCWTEIGFSFLPGMALLFILPAFQSWLGKYFASLRAKTAILRDERIKIMNEVICGMRVIKMYAWEYPFSKLVCNVRRKEIKKVANTLRLNALNAMLYLSTIPLVSTAMFIPYVLNGHTLTNEKVFTIVAIISAIHSLTSVFIPRFITGFKESGVSLHRIAKFLLLDEGKTLSANRVRDETHGVTFDNVCSSWNKESNENVLSNVTFKVSPGELLMIVGPVGCGKSSLLLTSLRELPVTDGVICINGRVAYVSQQPWVFSGTLRENILFGRNFDKKRYFEVIHGCALEKDIEALSDGDGTLVGERGVSLSGGQRARVNLARAIYMDADIYLMDDPLSAVDAHVSRHIFSNCIRGILKTKLCVLVTHQLQFLADADRILCLNKGNVVGYGNLKQLKKEGVDILSMIRVEEKQDEEHSFTNASNHYEQQITFRPKPKRQIFQSPQRMRKKHTSLSEHELSEKLLSDSDVVLRAHSAHDLSLAVVSSIQNQRLNASTSFYELDYGEKDQLFTQEDDGDISDGRITGRITFQIYKEYFLAGAKPLFLCFAFVVFLLGQCSLMISEWWLAQWSNWEESQVEKNISRAIIEEKREENLMIYIGSVLAVVLFAFARAVLWLQILISASRHLHDRMFNTVLRAPIYFFDTNPVGPVLNRFSKDIGLTDDMLPLTFFDSSSLALFALAILVMSVISLPYIAVFVVPIIGIFVWLRQYYLKSSREIKRMEALRRSPLYSHISATLQGLAIIRASEEQNQFTDMYNSYQDSNTAANFFYIAANRWLGYRLDMICATLMTIVCFTPLLVNEFGFEVNPVLVGLSLVYTKRLTGMFQYCVRQTAEVENQMVSVERILQYTQIESEAELEQRDFLPRESWPESGEIVGEDVTFRYHSSLPLVLKGINFHIKAKEKIGIVGRTGAGKSSLICALFRLAEPGGCISIDGIAIDKMGLHNLREKLSIIPQDPVIFVGSIRYNLDPFSNHEDDVLWNALEEVQLKEFVNNFPSKLEFRISESGNNLSVGQRQLICLARAIIKHNKILIIDEATANVDHKTDNLIQQTIREKFRDCTVLTIAHRLNTIMDTDRIMVLDAGEIIEFDEPLELLNQPQSLLSLMVKQTGKESSLQLHSLAKAAYEKRQARD